MFGGLQTTGKETLYMFPYTVVVITTVVSGS